MTENEISNKVIQAAIKVHSKLGPGLLESAYHACLVYEIQMADMNVISEKPVPVIYENVKLTCGYRIDMLVENKLVIEVKSVEAINDLHLAQLLPYLKLAEYKLGLILNFNAILLKQGIKRVINGTL